MISRRVKIAALLASAGLLVWALVALQVVLLPVLLGLLLAYLLDPLVAGLMRFRLSRPRAIAVLYGLGIALAVLLVLFAVPWFLGQLSTLARHVTELAERLPEIGVRLVTWLEARLKINLGMETEARTLSEQAKDWILMHREEILGLSRNVFGRAWSGFQGVALLLMNAVLVPVYGYFFLLGLPGFTAGLRDLLPVSYRVQGMTILTQIHQTMAAFFRGRLLVCAGKGVVAAAGMAIGGVPLGVFVGLASGALSLVPFLAFPAGALLGCTFALLEGQGLAGVLWVLGALGAAEAFEAVASPWILGREMALHPAVVLFSLFVGGKLLGVMGLLLAVPLASMVKIVWKELLFPWWKEVADRGPAP